MPEFTHCGCCRADKKSRWELVAAIAQDAVDAGLPITSADSVIAAKAAVGAVEPEMTADTVKNRRACPNSTTEVHRPAASGVAAYGTSTVQEVAKAGWSQGRPLTCWRRRSVGPAGTSRHQHFQG